MINSDADICANNDYTLRWVSYNGHIEVVKLLLERGANIHADDALRWASKNGHIEVTNLLKTHMNNKN